MRAQCIPQRLGMLGVQVDLILGTVQPEADRTFRLAAIEVVDKQGLYLWAMGAPFPHWPHHQPLSAEAHKRAPTSECCERLQSEP
jgi:hypothetical protein